MNKAAFQGRNHLFWSRLANRGAFGKARIATPQQHFAFSSVRPLPDDLDYESPRVVGKKMARSYPRLSLVEQPEQESVSSVAVDDSDATSNDPFESKSPMTLKFIDRECPIVSQLQLVTPEDDVPRGVWPVFRLMVSLS